MTNNETASYREVAEVQFRHVSTQLNELKDRVDRLESTLTRGVMLLMANLVGVAVSLAQQVMRG